HGQPLAVAKGLPRLVERFRDRHLPIVELEPDAVAVELCGEDLLHGEVPGLRDDQVDGLAVELGKELVFGQLVDLQLLMKDEIDISAVRESLGHGASGSDQ